MQPGSGHDVTSDEIGLYQEALARLLAKLGLTYKEFAKLGVGLSENDVDNFLRRKAEKPRVTERSREICRIIEDRFGGLRKWLKDNRPFAPEIHEIHDACASDAVNDGLDLFGDYVGFRYIEADDEASITSLRLYDDGGTAKFQLREAYVDGPTGKPGDIQFERVEGICATNGCILQLISAYERSINSIMLMTAIARPRRYPLVLRGAEILINAEAGKANLEKLYLVRADGVIIAGCRNSNEDRKGLAGYLSNGRHWPQLAGEHPFRCYSGFERLDYEAKEWFKDPNGAEPTRLNREGSHELVNAMVPQSDSETRRGMFLPERHMDRGSESRDHREGRNRVPAGERERWQAKRMR